MAYRGGGSWEPQARRNRKNGATRGVPDIDDGVQDLDAPPSELSELKDGREEESRFVTKFETGD